MLPRHRGFLLLCLLFWGIVRLQSAVLSPFEGPDEVEHFAYILKLRQTGLYPSYDDFDTTPIHQQVGQPPLYYTVAALFSLPLFPAEGLDAGRVKLNPWVGFNAPATSTDNRNYAMMNTAYQALEPDQQRLSEMVLATRGLSVFFGWLALAGIYWGGLAIWTNRNWALFAALLFGFSPPVLQVFSTVTNDAAVVAFSSLVVAASLHLVNRWNDQRLLLLTAFFVICASLSKVSGLTLAILPVIALFLGWWCASTVKRDYRGLIRGLLILSVIPAIFGGWWFIRSYLLYGDLLGTQPHQQMYWGFAELQSIGTVIQRLPIVAQTFWFNAGWGEVRPETWGYVFPTAVVVLSAVGWGLNLRRLPDFRLWILLFTLLIGVIGLIRWMQMSDLITGRLYLPYTPALALLLIWGIRTIPLADLWRYLLAGIAGAQTIIFAAAVIFPAFGSPALIDGAPQNLRGAPIDFGVARFIGYQIDHDLLVPGENRDVMLCWQAPPADNPIPVPFPFALQVIEAENPEQVQPGELIIASRESYPGLGKYTLWQPGKIFCDEFHLPVENTPEIERNYVLYLTLFDPISLAGLPGYDEDGILSNKIIGELMLP